MKQPRYETVTLEKIVGGGQAIGTLESGKKAFVWGGLPGETVTFVITKSKSSFVEGVVTEVITPSAQRVAPLDPDSYLSTSPWQIMDFESEQFYKAALIEEAFELHDIVLPNPIEVYTDNRTTHYRNKVEFSWYSDAASPLACSPSKPSETASRPMSVDPPSADNGVADVSSDFAGRVSRDSESRNKRVVLGGAAPTSEESKGFSEEGADRATGPAASDLSAEDAVSAPAGDDGSGGDERTLNSRGEWGRAGEQGDTLDLAFFRRGSKGKITLDECSLLPDSMMTLARAIRDLLHAKRISARSLKTLLIRCNQQGECVWQLYVKETNLAEAITAYEAKNLPALGGEIIYSDPRSPASRITTRLATYDETVLTDTVLDVPFRYATEGFFQVNIPVYEQALRDMRESIHADKPVVDLYSGVGSIGLTIGSDNVTLVEVNADAVREMRENINALGRNDSARAVLAASEQALDHITSDDIVIVDPPRAGLHTDVIARLLETQPERIIYLSCNPVTQARDVAMLGDTYGVRHHMGYNFFPRTPHIEHLVVLDKKA